MADDSEPTGKFAGDVAVVTGGTRGIGRAVAERFASLGAATVATYHEDTEAATETESALTAYDPPTDVERFDVGDLEAVCEAFDRITETFGRPTVLVNNAGQMDNGLVVRMDPEQWGSVIETNLTGTFYCTREATRRMLRGDGGRVVNVASVAGLRGWAGQANYAASKAGMIGFTRAVAQELGDRSIRVNAVAPGYVDTDLYAEHNLHDTDDVPVSEPEDVADVAEFLVSDAASAVNGSVYRVDEGLIG
ncbi:Rossmann-fold NAD(P)-binding domain-containing protein [Halorubrum pallidum]|uniref:SDR family NAD(P)-dependent oxidoreductase n=1 Tax=Halorubrum pallidum TaxID=1526114 RepID=A0ABD5T0P5_9EURY